VGRCAGKPGRRPCSPTLERRLPRRRRRPSPLRALVAGLAGPVRQFLATEAASGVVLLAATVAALVWANSPWRSSYRDVWSTRLSLGITLDLRQWGHQGLMTFFFLVVGLEIKRELVAGELRDRRAARLPVIAAVGGMVVPALIYLAFNAGGAGERGWGVPMATDIAFALGVVALLGSRVPPAVRLLLLTMAVVDDLGSLIVIALFYSHGVQWWPLLAAGGVVVALLAFRRLGVDSLLAYVPFGVGLWVALHAAGVQPATSGALLGVIAPAGRSHPVVERMEALLHPWVSFAIVPVFAVANAGIVLSASVLRAAASSPVTGGVVAGRVVGKVLGVTGATWIACRLGIASLPREAGWRHVLGVGALAGIGFTVAIFVTDAALTAKLAGEAKVGILAAAVLAAVPGAAVLAFAQDGRAR
jgi:NhaA family Na+:H+ antiporter